MSKEKAFRALALRDRYEYLRKNGTYIDSRSYGSYRIHLYEADGFYTEVWQRVAFKQVQWIEVIDLDRVSENYADNLDLKKNLGL